MAATEQARFALCYGVSPSDYRDLTQLERQAFHTEARRIAEQT